MADEAGKVPDKVDEDGNGDSGVPQVAGLGTGEAEGATTSAQADGGGEPAAKGVSNDDPIEGTDEYGGEVLEGSMGAESLRSKMYTLQQKELNAGVIDEQFTQLKQLEDDSNPDFVKEVLEMYVSDSKDRLRKMDDILEADEPNYGVLESVVHQMKGSSASVGALQVAAACTEFRQVCASKSKASCQEVVSDIRAKVDRVFEGFEEYLYLHKKLQSVLKGNKEIFQYRTRKRRREDDET